MKNSALLEEIKKTGLTEEQAIKALSVIANYAKERFPILQGNINAYLKQEFKHADPELVSKFFDR